MSSQQVSLATVSFSGEERRFERVPSHTSGDDCFPNWHAGSAFFDTQNFSLNNIIFTKRNKNTGKHQ